MLRTLISAWPHFLARHDGRASSQTTEATPRVENIRPAPRSAGGAGTTATRRRMGGGNIRGGLSPIVLHEDNQPKMPRRLS